MKLLVLGGTAWLGQTVTAAALEAGHDVTCLARGASGVPVQGARFIQGDRDDDHAFVAVSGVQWDGVIDVARHPGHVRRAASVLAQSTAHYVFVSTGNVYADQQKVGADESVPLLPPLEGDLMPDMARYGEAKVACERHVLGAFGEDRCAIARAGLIGGPGDMSGRSVYWPMRFARPSVADGRVLVPDALDQATQLVDVRDLAVWLLHLATARISGVYNATGPTTSLNEHLQQARAVAGHSEDLVLADPHWLTAHGVNPWMGPRSLPLWLNDPTWAGFLTRDSSSARAAGLEHRPLDTTLADALNWGIRHADSASFGAGLTHDEERALFAELAC
jgi:2'-hydroxyisoflavone reductase